MTSSLIAPLEKAFDKVPYFFIISSRLYPYSFVAVLFRTFSKSSNEIPASEILEVNFS